MFGFKYGFARTNDASSNVPLGTILSGTTTAVGTNPFGTTTAIGTNPFGITTAVGRNSFGTPTAVGTNPFGTTAIGTNPFGTTIATGTNPFGTTTAGISGSGSGTPNGSTSGLGSFSLSSGGGPVFGRPCSQDIWNGSATVSSKSNSPFINSGPFQSGSQGTFIPFDKKTSEVGGSSKTSYEATAMEGERGVKVLSISGMSVYSGKSHEELRWEDYQLRVQGANGSGPVFMTSTTPNPVFPQTNATMSTSVFGLTTTSSSTSSFSGGPFSNVSPNSPFSSGIFSNGQSRVPFFNNSTLNANQLTNRTSNAPLFLSPFQPYTGNFTFSNGTGPSSSDQVAIHNPDASLFPSPFQPNNGNFTFCNTTGLSSSNQVATQNTNASAFPSSFQPNSNFRFYNSTGSSSSNQIATQNTNATAFPSPFEPNNDNFNFYNSTGSSSSNQIATQNTNASAFPSPFQPNNGNFTFSNRTGPSSSNQVATQNPNASPFSRAFHPNNNNVSFSNRTSLSSSNPVATQNPNASPFPSCIQPNNANFTFSIGTGPSSSNLVAAQNPSASAFPFPLQSDNGNFTFSNRTGPSSPNQVATQNPNSSSFPSLFQPNNGNFAYFNESGLSSSNHVAAPNLKALPFPSPFQPSKGGSVFSNGTTEKPFNLESHVTNLFLPKKQPEVAQTAGLSSTAASFHFPASIDQSNYAPQISMAKVDIQPVKDPFGVKQKISQSSCGLSSSDNAKFALSHQSGISGMSVKVVEKPASSRVSSLLTARHVSQTKITIKKVLQTKNTCQRVPFFNHEGTGLSTLANHPAPRVNIRSVLLTGQGLAQRKTSLRNTNESAQVTVCSKTNINNTNQATLPNKEAECWKESTGNLKPTSEGASNSSQISAEEITPKLKRSDYYTEPSISELLVKEDSTPGYMSRVGQFIIGRHGFGYVEFEGDTDVRGLDLDSAIDFNAGEVTVYAEGVDKPPVGKGLNKPALITLLKVKCIKRIGEQYVEGKTVERYEEKLKRVAEKQGAEFVSYDPVAGEWKFRVEHF